MNFFDEITRITRAHCERMGYTKAAAPKPVPQIWKAMGVEVWKRDEFFCWCPHEEDARFIAERLNAFDANLEERNAFQRMYLRAKEDSE